MEAYAGAVAAQKCRPCPSSAHSVIGASRLDEFDSAVLSVMAAWILLRVASTKSLFALSQRRESPR